MILILHRNSENRISYSEMLMPENKMKYPEVKAHLSKFTVGIAGAGGLGSNCAVSLARSGIGTLVIADYDIIEETNLSRQYYFAHQIGSPKSTSLKENIFLIDPGVKVVEHQKRINRENAVEIFSGCDVIIEALDSPEMKEMLIETVLTKMPGIPIIVGSGLAGWKMNTELKIRKIDDTLYVCGDENTEVNDEMPPLAPRVGIVANLQAGICIELLMNIRCL